MGFSVYIILCETKAKILEHRTYCALTVPPVTHGPHCYEADACRESFAHAWWGEIAKHGVAVALIHPVQIPASKILSSLTDLETSWHMSRGCRDLTVQSLSEKALADVFLREDKYIADAVKQLQ
ncbi:hypothetical protein C8R47DRAFT_1136525 [Mycena vitilis]|nr:hypothetical protein C8R47DRAFT_1165845 [Mycena vitilis]KAJ6479968.1 hypothetical protein C8R47DRAFT_1136525 [Mycena vitilis]